MSAIVFLFRGWYHNADEKGKNGGDAVLSVVPMAYTGSGVDRKRLSLELPLSQKPGWVLAESSLVSRRKEARNQV
jgi:hypothetical protein